MTESTRSSALASRHRALGSALEDWNGMGTAWSYNSDPCKEHDAVREAAGLFDMSPLKKVYVRGPDAAAVVDYSVSRNMQTINPGQSCYTSVLTAEGTVADDAIVANCGANEFLFCHGSGDSMALLEESAQGRNVHIELDDDLHNLALQGPAALGLLERFCSDELAKLDYFNHLETRLFGHACRISRTGYSGERGYEIFAASGVVTDIWDALLSEGQSSGVMPCSFTALDKVRIEAALLFYGYDMTDQHTPWEVGLGFTLSQDKRDYRGKHSAMASRGQQRFVTAGIVAEHGDMLNGGEQLYHRGEPVGVVNSPAWSHRLGLSLALVHLDPHLQAPGTQLEVVGDINCQAKVASIPFYDPQKLKTHIS